MTRLLVTRSRHDTTNNYLFYWAGKVIDEVKNRGNISVIDLSERRANQEELTGVINKVKPELVFFNGHGSSTTVTGYENQVLVESGKNETLLGNAIVYALSCSSAAKLGQDCVNHGAKAYIGYKDSFIFIHETKSISRPLGDQTAKLFFDPSNLVVNSLAKGNAAHQAHQKSQRAFQENIKKLATSESPQTDGSLIHYLLWDMTNQVCLESEKNHRS